MNILGIGIPEIIVIFIIMLVVAGPKRMIEWAYHIGRYTAKIRAMYQETMEAFQKELNASGLDDVTKDLSNLRSNSFDIVSEASKIINTEVQDATSAVSDAASDAASAASATLSASSTPSVPSIAPDLVESSTASPDSQPATPPLSDSQNNNNQPRYNSWVPSDSQSDDERPRYDSWTQN